MVILSPATRYGHISRNDKLIDPLHFIFVSENPDPSELFITPSAIFLQCSAFDFASLRLYCILFVAQLIVCDPFKETHHYDKTNTTPRSSRVYKRSHTRSHCIFSIDLLFVADVALFIYFFNKVSSMRFNHHGHSIFS